MSTLMMFQLGANVLNFEAAASYPASRPVEIFQVQDRTASGSLQVETLGVQVQRRTLLFDSMPEADYQALLDWFLNVVNGGEKSFDFTDEKGFLGEVKITDSIIDFPETSYQAYSGVLNLEYI